MMSRRIIVEHEIDPQILLRFVLIMLFRLGGEQKFTLKEMNEIQDLAGGITFRLTEDDTTILKFRSASSMEALFPLK